jgi:hypothetical protein
MKQSIFRWLFFKALIFILFISSGQEAAGQNQTKADSMRIDSMNKAAQQSQMQNTATKPVTTQPKANIGKRDTRPLSQRLDFDISTSFWVNTSSTFFEFSPVIIYKFPKTFAVGTGPAYIYNRDRVKNVDLHGWGWKVFGRAQLLRWVYAYTEYQGINNQYIAGVDAQNNLIKSEQFVDSWFLSVGFNIKLTRRTGIYFQALYDVLYDKSTSPYLDAWTYRFGFGF